jgi:D-sedoheptulose 7-phosphate isomerase
MLKPVSFHDSIRDHLNCVQELYDAIPTLESIAKLFTACLSNGGTIYLCGNGGSAADCQHVAGEFVGRFLRERRPLPAVALTTDTSVLTAIANDYGYETIFSRQVRALAKAGDVVVGISTSGKSPNVLNAVAAAKELNAATVAFTGSKDSPLAADCDLAFRAPSGHTPRVQELHFLAWHMLCDKVEEAMCVQPETLRHAA